MTETEQGELFGVDPELASLTVDEKLKRLLYTGNIMRVAQIGYFKTPPGPEKQTFLRAAKMSERQFDHLLKSFNR